jgi:Protein of unknown function (DUF3035)
MKARWIACALIVTAAMTAGGCDSTWDALRGGKRSPDEFLVYSRKPLNVPPNYDLRPPASEAGRAVSNEPVTEARTALLESSSSAGMGAAARGAQPAAGSPGQMALLEQSGALTADPEVRAQISRETTVLAEVDQSFTDRLMFWSTPTEYGTVVNPGEEARRIRENQALGKPVTAGQTPTIARSKRALLEGIF